MADIEISYGGDTIVSLNDSGVEVLETKGKFLTDDITVTYTKSGGGSVQTRQVTIPAVSGTPRLCYTDNTMTVNVIDGLSEGLTFEAPVGSIVTITTTSTIVFPPGESPVGVTQIASYVSGRYTYARIYSVDAVT